MKSEDQYGKMEPASHATVWGFIIGKVHADQLRNAVNQFESLLYASYL
jgi:hypothetical protein